MSFSKPFVLLFCLFSFSLFGQKIEQERYPVEYVQQPISPLPKAVLGYEAKINLVYKDELLSEMAKDGQDFESRQKEYEKKYLEAERRRDSLDLVYDKQYAKAVNRYDSLMAIYNEKTNVEKYVEKRLLQESERPIFIAPRRKHVRFPLRPEKVKEDYQKIFDEDQLKNAHLKLEGYKETSTNALKITVDLYGFEYLDPVLRTNLKRVYNTQSQTTTTSTYYWYEVAYRHPMNLKVELPDGTVLVDEVFKELSDYSKYKSASSTSSSYRIDAKGLKLLFQDEVVTRNLEIINNYINDQYGYPLKTREVVLYRVFDKKKDYSKHQEAYENIVVGYSNFSLDTAKAKNKIRKAIGLWQEEADMCKPFDKKARVNAKVGKATQFNLAEAKIWLELYDEAEVHLSKIIGMRATSKERESINELRSYLKYMKER